MGLKRGAIGNTIGEHIGNLMGTHWELERNMLGTKENENSDSLYDFKKKSPWV